MEKLTTTKFIIIVLILGVFLFVFLWYTLDFFLELVPYPEIRCFNLNGDDCICGSTNIYGDFKNLRIGEVSTNSSINYCCVSIEDSMPDLKGCKEIKIK
jgi:hypothetical protein